MFQLESLSTIQKQMTDADKHIHTTVDRAPLVQ